ncbi:MAG: glycosyltransferase family 2 protein, partial [Planctomycetota bacterium]|nr:glycosyltransferase family 2 protein [Planctomycetota bacterium]
SIVIPAYDEEDAIVPIVERCLAARATIVAETDVREVEVIVVSDGSTDRTVERVHPLVDGQAVRLVDYAPNRGYGVALKTGFRAASGDLVAFLDADGTCDPLWFVPLVQACTRDGASVATGCRMTATSRMPPLRRLGNRFFRGLINTLARAEIRDSASGMRVIRRECLPWIFTLPDGMHFTPAMTATAVFDPGLTLREVDMPYEERVGRSKLSVVKDGLRFLRCILDVCLLYRPLRLFGPPALALLALALLLGATIAWAKFVDPAHAHLPRWYLFRMITALVAAALGLTLLMVGVVAERVGAVVRRSQPPAALVHALVRPLLGSHATLLAGGLCVALGLTLNVGTAYEWLTTRHIEVDTWWTYAITGGFLLIVGSASLALSVLNRVLGLLEAGLNEGKPAAAYDPPEAA